MNAVRNPGPSAGAAGYVLAPADGTARYVEDKSVVPVIEAVYPLDEIAAAHRSLETSGGFGKRVVQVA